MTRYVDTGLPGEHGGLHASGGAAKHQNPVQRRVRWILCLALLPAVLFAVPAGAWAQNAPPPVPPALNSGSVPIAWQFSFGYQYNRPDIKGAYPPFSTNGFNGSVVWYFGRFAGIEGDAGVGFGSYAPHDSFASLSPSAGLHLVYHNRSRFEPWAHGLLGASYYHFEIPQPPELKNVAMSWTMGGGVDVRIRRGITVRLEGDYFGSHFGAVYQKDLQAVSGLVWNF